LSRLEILFLAQHIPFLPFSLAQFGNIRLLSENSQEERVTVGGEDRGETPAPKIAKDRNKPGQIRLRGIWMKARRTTQRYKFLYLEKFSYIDAPDELFIARME
jgi:hypothetical protein